MNWPTSQDYNEAVQDPATSFSDPDLKGGQVVVNAMGLPVPRSGNFADVYQFTGANGKAWALKCFTRKVAGLRERYARIDEHLAKAKLPFTVGFRFLEKGVQVRGEWFPLLKMEWVEGFTLNDFVARNLTKPDLLHRLTQMWAKLAGRLRDANMAHADLQHGNVLLVPGATPQKLGLKLIDYDGMWVPALAEHHSGEVGHPNFQHPLRLKERVFSGEVDRFPHLVIAAGLRAALVGGKPIWDKFDNEDNLLFKEADFRDPAKAPVFKALWELNDPVLRTLVGHIALSTKQPLRKTPWLDDVLFQEGGPKLTPDEERRVCEMLGVSTAAPAAARVATPAAVEQEFNVFQFMDEDEDPMASLAAASGRRPVAKRRAAAKKSKAPLLIGGRVAAVVLLLGGIAAAVALNNNKKDRPTETVQAPPDELPKASAKDPNLTGSSEPVAKGTVGEPDAKWTGKYLHLGPRGDVTLANTAGLLDPNKAFTVELWVRTKSGRFHQMFFRDDSIDDEAGPGRRTRGVAFRLGAREARGFPLHLLFGADAPEWWDVAGHAHPVDGEWHHLAICKTPDEVRIFRDGKLDAKKPCAGIKFYPGTSNLRLGIGANGHPAGSSDADFRAFRVSKGAIYENEFAPASVLPKTPDTLVLLDFAAGSGTNVPDRSGRRHHGVIVDGNWAEEGDTSPAPPPSGGPPGLVAGIAALPGGRDFLFVRQNDPVLHSTVNGLARPGREIGRAPSPLRVVAATPDGSKAVTGAEDGTVGIWNLKGDAGAPAGGGPQMKTRIASFKKIDTFNDRWSLDAYQEGIVIHDFERKLDATISVGEPGRPVKGAFAGNLKNNAKLAEHLGQAVTDEINLYDGDLIVQVFEGGVQFYSKTVEKSWFGWHAKRKPAADGGPVAAPQRADYVWVDDALPPGARPILTDPGAADWEFVDAAAGPVHSGQKSVKIVATGARQTVFADARPALRVGTGDVLFAYVYLDPKNPPEEIMLQWAGHGWQRGGFRRAYWGANKLQWGREGSPELKSMGPLPKVGQWVRLEVKIDDLDIQPEAAISSLALTQFGGTAYWDAIGVNTATPQGPAIPTAAAQPQRSDEVWLDDALPPGGKPSIGGTNVDCTFIDKNDGPVHSGEKAIRLTANGLQQIVIEGVNPEPRVNAGDLLVAYVYVDPKNPPEEIMLQWCGSEWQPFEYHRYYWGTKKTPWPGKAMGDLPTAGKWVRLEMKIDETDVKPGATVDRFALTQVGGTVYWDTIGVSRAPSEGPGATGSKALKGHTGPVVACAVSPDGSRAVTLGSDKLLCEWDLAGARLVRKFEVPEARTVAFLPDGKSVLIGTEADSAGVWELETKTRTKEVAGHTTPVRAVCVSPHGDMAWTAGEDGEIRSWAVPEFRQLGAFSNQQKPVAALAVSDNGQVLAAAGPDGWVRYFNGRTGRPLGGGGGRLPINAVAILPGGTKVAAAWGPDPVVADLPRPRDTGNVPSLPPPPTAGSSVLKLLQETDAPGGQVHRMGYGPDGKHLWLSHQDAVTVADGPTGKEIKTITVDGRNVMHAAFGPGTQLYVVLAGGRFQAWDWQKGERLHDYDPAEQKGALFASVWPLPAANRLLVSTYSPAVIIWDAAKWKEVERLTPYGTELVTHVAPYPTGNRFAAVVGSGQARRLVVWDLAQKKELFRLDGPAERGLFLLEVSPNGRWIVGHTRDGDDGRLTIWNGRTGKLAHTIPGIKPSGFGGAFSATGDRYLYPDLNGRRLVINLTDGKMTDESAGRPVAFRAAGAPAANLVATADADRKVRIWQFDPDAKGTTPSVSLEPKTSPTTAGDEKTGFLKDSAGLSGSVVAAALSTDGKRVFVATEKGTVHVLDTTTAEEKAKYDVCKGGLIHMVLSPKYISPVNGAAIPEKLYLLDDERKLHVWDTDKGTRTKDVSLDKAGLPAVTSNTRVIIAANETHVLFFDPGWARGYSWSVGRWDETNIPPVLKRPPFNTDTKTVAFAADGSFGAAWASRKLLVWKVRGGKVYPVIDTATSGRWLAIAGEAGVVVSGDSGRLQAWKIEGGTEVMNVREPHGLLRDYQAAASANSLVTAGADRWLRVWDPKAGTEAAKWRLDSTPAGVAVSSDGRRAVVWQEGESTVSLWGLPDPKGK